jgi:hypothetical protein
MGWQMNRNARISGDSSAARGELREDLFKPSRKEAKEKKNKTNCFSSHSYQEALVLSIISSYPHFSASIWGC